MKRPYKCKYCNKIFFKYKRVNRKHIYCSVKCHGLDKRTYTKININCKYCHIKLKVKLYEKRPKPQFCSMKCWYKWIKKQPGVLIKRDDGYITIKMPSALSVNKKGYIYEHRLIMERYLNRKLSRREVVHHVNRNTSDNRIENLKLMKQGDHIRSHLKLIDKWARNFDECIKCKTNLLPYIARGLCRKCYKREEYLKSRGRMP